MPYWSAMAPAGISAARNWHSPTTSRCCPCRPIHPSSTHGERLGLPAPEQALCPRLGHLRRHPRRLSKRLALPRQRPRTNPLDRSPALGLCHSLRRLVLARKSVVQVTSVSVLVALVGRRILQTKTPQKD